MHAGLLCRPDIQATILLPEDEGFNEDLEDGSLTLEDIIAEPNFLKTVLFYHAFYPAVTVSDNHRKGRAIPASCPLPGFLDATEYAADGKKRLDNQASGLG